MVVPEPSGGAHRDHDESARLLGGYIARALQGAPGDSPVADRKRQRRDRYRRIGAYREVAAGDPTAIAAGRHDNGSSNGSGASS